MSAIRRLHWTDALRYRALLRVRPIAAASALKRALGVRRFVWEMVDGRRYWIDPVSNLGRHLLFRGGYEEPVARLVRLLLRSGDTFLDIGANEGYFSVLAGSLVGASGRVHSFEPQSRLREVLRRNFALNGLGGTAVAHRFALGREPGSLTLHLTPDVNTGASGARRHWRFGAGTETVRVETLDGFAARKAPGRARLAKIDVEGAEEHVLAGAASFLAGRRADFIVVEFHPHICGRESCARAAALLSDAGYRRTIVDGVHVYHAIDLPKRAAR